MKYNRMNFNTIFLIVFLIITILIFKIIVLNRHLKDQKEKTTEIKNELINNKIYLESFNELITEIRIKQHAFNNHINAIYSQHNILHTYEELVECQKKYCEEIKMDDEYVRMLDIGNVVISGYLYILFQKAKKNDVNIEYNVKVEKLKTKIPDSIFIEILGILSDNAFEELENHPLKIIKLSIIQTANSIKLEISNISRNISMNEMQRLFSSGCSTKGTNRGLGLYQIKKLSIKYDFKIICSNEKIDNKNWMKIRLDFNCD